MNNAEEKIRQLLRKDTWTNSEKEEIYSLVAETPQNVDRANVILQEYFENDLEQGLEGLNSDKSRILLTRIHERLGASSKPVQRVHFLQTSWFKYAAAVILFFGAAVYFWIANKKSEQTLASGSNASSAALITDIAPGHDRAILTLANGQQIILDSTQGNIVKQGNLTVVNLAGKLKYEGIGTGADYNSISTPKGGQYQIVLPDGSKVWLNAASSIKFPTAFMGSVRNVEITGEAYMEIARNPKQSFIVTLRQAQGNGTEIQVLGTSFNVNAYEDEAAIKTTLISGSVKVISDQQQNSMAILKPGQQAIVIPFDKKLKIIDNADITQTLAWTNGVFQLNHSNLAEIMRQLARWYDIEVVYKNGVPDIKLGGNIKRDLTLSQVLDGLGELGVKFRIGGRQVIIL